MRASTYHTEVWLPLWFGIHGHILLTDLYESHIKGLREQTRRVAEDHRCGCSVLAFFSIPTCLCRIKGKLCIRYIT